MRDLLLACVVFGALPFVLKRPFWGILLLAWLGYMNPHRLAYGFMLSFPVVQVVVLFTLAGMLISKEEKRLVWSREITMLVIFVAWMGITTTQALYPDLAEVQYVKVIKIQILTFMTLLMLTSPEKIKALVWMIALSLGFYGFKGGLFTIANGGTYHVWGPDGTFIGGNNELALALVMTIPLLRFVQMQETRRWLRYALTVLMLLCAISAIGSQSRGALLALSITAFMFWLKGRNKLVSGVLIVVVAAFILSLMPEAWYERMGTIKTYGEDNSALGRINAWWMAFYMALDRPFGGGFESFLAPSFAMYAPEPNRVHDSHSIYFQVLGHHGFIGLALFLSLLALMWLKCSAIRRTVKRTQQNFWASDLAQMIQVSQIAYMVGGAFLGLAYFDYLYHLLAITVVTHKLALAPPRAGPVAENAGRGYAGGRPAGVPRSA